MSGILLGAGGLRHCRCAQSALFPQQRLHTITVSAAVRLFQLRQLVHIASCALQYAARGADIAWPLLAGRNCAEQIGIRLQIAGHLILRGLDLGVCRYQRGALGIDLRPQISRQFVETEKRHNQEGCAENNCQKS